MLKPTDQHTFLLTGFSPYILSQLPSNRTTVSATAEPGHNHMDVSHPRPQHGIAVNANAFVSPGSKLPSNSDDSGMSDSDPENSGEDRRSSSDDEQEHICTDGKTWAWIFKIFPGRTQPAIRTRWNMVQSRLSVRNAYSAVISIKRSFLNFYFYSYIRIVLLSAILLLINPVGYRSCFILICEKSK
ncbi:hypothetical protein B0O99DRAFT_622743 [Bisporella sp. PMI_857]|nr:hypothetical protein B0O99DRAFT_622743 [Bisporella sp. PMI_857]